MFKKKKKQEEKKPIDPAKVTESILDRAYEEEVRKAADDPSSFFRMYQPWAREYMCDLMAGNHPVSSSPPPLKVTIEKLDRGFSVVIGCKKIAVTSWDELSKGLAEYFDNPVAAEKKYFPSRVHVQRFDVPIVPQI